MNRPVRLASLLTLGMLFLQAAWVFAVPPFRGIDEFDHAYRAAAVAHGQLLPSSEVVADGRGAYLSVPPSIVKAASPICSRYHYTGHDNCNPVRPVGKGLVEVASGAARYNPAFYWLTGKAAQPFEGTGNLYVTRVSALLLCLGFFWLAAYALASSFRTVWPLGALTLSVTPVFVYSTSLGAPNGVEMTSALALWCSLLGLGARHLERTQERALILIGMVSTAVLVTPRLLGPMWAILILAAVVCCLGRRRTLQLFTAHRVLMVVTAVVVVAATLAALVWNRLAAPNALSAEPDLGLGNPLGNSLAQFPLYAFQSIAAFPGRDEPAPLPVYVAGLLALGLAAFIASRGVDRRWWSALAGLVVVWLGVQLVVTVSTYSHLGPVWQGRYALPFSAGIPVVMAALSERAGVRLPTRSVAVGLAGLLFVAHAVSIAGVYLRELETSPYSGTPQWVDVPAGALVLLVAAACAAVVAALCTAGNDSRAPEGAVTPCPAGVA